MEKIETEFNKIKINAALIISKRMVDNIDEMEYVKHISTYINHIDNLYIYNMTKQDLTSFYERLAKYQNIEYTDFEDCGEVYNYQFILENLYNVGTDFGVVLEQGYYYEEDAFLSMRRFLIENNYDKIAILTPLPLRGCEIFFNQVEDYRPCMGCNFVGTLINMKIFNELSPLKLEYYQTTFDYEYCLRVRSKGYEIILLQNQVLRNQNYRVLEKRLLFITLSTYDYNLMDIYYQTRNRLYLWDEYKDIDPKYVKLDKKLYRGERHVMKVRDKNYRDKFYMMEEAHYDYYKGLKGKYKESKKNERN